MPHEQEKLEPSSKDIKLLAQTLIQYPKSPENLTDNEKVIFCLLSPILDKETLGFLPKLHQLYPNLVNFQDLDRANGKTALMQALSFGNFPYAITLLNLGADVTAINASGQNILSYIANSLYYITYRTEEIYEMKEILPDLFTESRTLTQDELQIFQRIYEMHDWSQNMDNASKIKLLSDLDKCKKESIVNFLEFKTNFFDSLALNTQEKIKIFTNFVFYDEDKDTVDFFAKNFLTSTEETIAKEMFKTSDPIEYSVNKIKELIEIDYTNASKEKQLEIDQTLQTILTMIPAIKEEIKLLPLFNRSKTVKPIQTPKQQIHEFLQPESSKTPPLIPPPRKNPSHPRAKKEQQNKNETEFEALLNRKFQR